MELKSILWYAGWVVRFGVPMLCLLLAWGCRTPHVEYLPRADTPERCVHPAPERGLMIGIALSGGGSRAAPPVPI
jgi:hypothetical protein